MSHTLYDIAAPAKLNLFLHITGRRDDGYHLLQSVFMLIDWQDLLHIERTASANISRSDTYTTMRLSPSAQPSPKTTSDMSGVCATQAHTQLPADDLCVRAARALQAATGCSAGAHIHLHKTIPQQAGMGGGSSDAASTLVALNRLWNLGLSRRELATIGLTLGADVPFFIHGHNAWVEGVGERITALQGPARLPDAQFLVIKPASGLPTPRIFAHPQLVRDTPTATIAAFCPDHYGFGRNDLQPVAQSLCSEIGQVLEWLHTKSLQGKMTGSGTAVFSKLPGNIQVADFEDIPPHWSARLCRNLPHHPLVHWLPQE